MKRWIIVCALLALAQAGLTFWTHWGHENSGESAQGPLVAVQASAVNGLLLEDAEGRKVELSKQNDHWVLPASGGFLADSGRIQGLIEKLVHLQRGWPEAATSEAATRFKVTAEHFVHRLTFLEHGRPLQVIYFGTSPGLRKLYLRVDRDPEIHSLALADRDLDTKADEWIDTTVLHLTADQIERVRLPGVVLEQGKDGLQPVALQAGEELVKDRRDALVNRLTGLSITALLGKEVKPEYGLEYPALEYSVELKDGATIRYQFGQSPKPVETKDAQAPLVEDAGVVLKVSNQEQLLRVDGWQVEALKTASRSALVRAKAAAAPVSPAAVEPEPTTGSAPTIPLQLQPMPEADTPSPGR